MRNILIVDDDEDDKDFLVEALKDIDPDIRCQWFDDSVHALNHLSGSDAEIPDYIFLDLKMPKINGFQWLQLLRMLEKYQQVPVIFHSGSRVYCNHFNLSGLGPLFFLCKHPCMTEMVRDLEGIFQAKPSLIIQH